MIQEPDPAKKATRVPEKQFSFGKMNSSKSAVDLKNLQRAQEFLIENFPADIAQITDKRWLAQYEPQLMRRQTVDHTKPRDESLVKAQTKAKTEHGSVKDQ